nr:hypothetical protein [Tanacetum cinerariifolium]
MSYVGWVATRCKLPSLVNLFDS